MSSQCGIDHVTVVTSLAIFDQASLDGQVFVGLNECRQALVSNGKHPMRKRLLAGALAGGVLLGVWAMIDGIGKETLRGSVKDRQLKAVALKLPEVYDATLVTSVSAQVTVHDENPVPLVNQVPLFRDLRNHTLTDSADVIVNVGTKLRSLQATPDPKTGKLTVVLRGDPDPAKSDLVLQASIDPASERIGNQGNGGDVVVNTFFGAAKAVAQATGKDFISPVDNTNTVLAKTAHLLMYDAVMSGPNNCANLGISQLNQENSAKLVSFDTPNPPKTLKQAIARIIFDTYATKHHEVLSPNDIDVRFDLSPQGLPNSFHDDLVRARTVAHNERIQLQSPASYPPCSLGVTQGKR